MNDLRELNETDEQPKTKAKAVKPKPATKRRNFAALHAELQGRVDMALRVLARCQREGATLEGVGDLVSIAVETLKGET